MKNRLRLLLRTLNKWKLMIRNRVSNSFWSTLTETSRDEDVIFAYHFALSWLLFGQPWSSIPLLKKDLSSFSRLLKVMKASMMVSFTQRENLTAWAPTPTKMASSSISHASNKSLIQNTICRQESSFAKLQYHQKVLRLREKGLTMNFTKIWRKHARQNTH